MGNRENIMDRWYESDRWTKEKRNPRGAFNGTPQFPFDKLYITPFTHERKTDEYGNSLYLPIEGRNFTPTGVEVMDDYIRHMQRGESNIRAFCKLYNARVADIDSLVFLLTGMSNQRFRAAWQVRTADLLLRYTDMKLNEIARRSGMGTRNNMYFIYERELNTSAKERRDAIRKNGDLGRFIIKE